MRKLTNDEYVRRLAERNPGIEAVQEYDGMNTAILVRCRKCGHEFEAKPANLLGSKNKRPSGCARCARNMKKTLAQYTAELHEKMPGVEVVGDSYENNKSRLRFRCRACEYEWQETALAVLQGHGCPRCAAARLSERNMDTQEEFERKAREGSPHLEVIGKYRGSHRKIKVRCRKCGKVQDVTEACLLTQGKAQCRKCGWEHTSYLEKSIRRAFELVLDEDEVLARDRSLIGRELDIYIPSKRLAIEPGSWFWHEGKTGADAEKRRLCHEKGVRLITVYDSCPEGYDSHDPDCLCICENLGKDGDLAGTRKLIRALLQEAGASPHLTRGQWSEVDQYARTPLYMTTQEFRERLAKVNPDVDVIGEYRGEDQLIEMRCLRPGCGKAFEKTPREMLRLGRGCPHCRHERAHENTRKSQAEFCEQVSAIRPDVEVIGAYVSKEKPVLVRCRTCGREWEPRAGNLLHCVGNDSGCKYYRLHDKPSTQQQLPLW